MDREDNQAGRTGFRQRPLCTTATAAIGDPMGPLRVDKRPFASRTRLSRHYSRGGAYAIDQSHAGASYPVEQGQACGPESTTRATRDLGYPNPASIAAGGPR